MNTDIKHDTLAVLRAPSNVHANDACVSDTI